MITFKPKFIWDNGSKTYYTKIGAAPQALFDDYNRYLKVVLNQNRTADRVSMKVYEAWRKGEFRNLENLKRVSGKIYSYPAKPNLALERAYKYIPHVRDQLLEDDS